MRPTVVPQALNGRPLQTADALALGVSWKTLQGSHFRRLAKGVYVAATTADSHRIHVRAVMLALPPGTIATGVTGLQLLGVDVGSQLPLIFATTHPRQVRRRDVKVMRLKELPAHRNGVAGPEQCWLVAASTLNLLGKTIRTKPEDLPQRARSQVRAKAQLSDLQAEAKRRHARSPTFRVSVLDWPQDARSPDHGLNYSTLRWEYLGLAGNPQPPPTRTTAFPVDLTRL